MYLTRHRISVTTDGDGDGTGYSDTPANGEVKQIVYTKDATTPYADTVDFDVTAETSGAILLAEDNVTATAQRAPMQATHLNSSGAAALYASGGTAVLAPVVIANERIKVVVANGGGTKTGVFEYTLGAKEDGPVRVDDKLVMTVITAK